MLAGSATRVINPELGDDLAGQLHRRFCDFIRDNLEANFLYLTEGQEQVLLVSLDLIGLHRPEGLEIAGQIASVTGVPAQNVLFCCTHTHAGPDTFGLLHDAPRNTAYLAHLRDALVAGAQEAVSGARPARVGWGRGAAHVGYNRRLCWANGTRTMYGGFTRPDFTGLEGPDDPSHAVLYAVDEAGDYVAILHNNSCHATTMEGDNFASADFPGEARREVRSALDRPRLPVLYLQGASGDTSPWNMLHTPHRYDGNRRAREIGTLLGAETLRLLHEVEEISAPVLRTSAERLPLEVRLPNEEELAHAREVQAQGEEAAGRWDYVLAVDGVLRLWEEFHDHPTDELPLHAVRIGDLALISNPCELYCQFGLDLKRRSPAAVTMVAELTNGSVGYCPTIPAIMGGGYSGMPIHWTRLEPYAGYKLVETSLSLLNELWQD